MVSFPARTRNWIGGAALVLLLAAVAAVWVHRRPPTVLRAGATHSPPETIWTKEGTVSGLGRDVLEEAAKRSGYQIQWVRLDATRSGCDAGFRDGSLDLCPVVGVIPWRVKEFHVTRAWLRNDFSLVSLAQHPVRPEQVTQATRVSFVRGAVTIQNVGRLFPQAAQLGADTRVKAFQAMCRGEADAVFLDTGLYQRLLHSRPPDCETSRFFSEIVVGGAVDMAFGGPKHRAGELDALRREVDGMRADGSFVRMLSRWQPMWFSDTEALFQQQELHWRAMVWRFGLAGALFLVAVLAFMNRRISMARAAAERAAAAKSEFIANMSHEIRTPLSGVLSTAELLERCRLDSEGREYVEIIRSSGLALQQLLSDMLDMKKIEAGKLSIEFTPFEVASVFRGVVDAFRGAAVSKGLVIRLEVAPDVPVCLNGDVLRLRQVLSNLAGNAVKFTHRGEVVVSATWDGSLCVEVRDTGIGISRDVLPLLFGKFVQADSSITKRFGGTGLGLSLCKSLVEAMGGSIEVESEEGHGTIFRFSLPWKVGTMPADERQAAGVNGDSSERSYTVLLAEDNATNQLIVRRLLEKAGCRVDIVDDGEQAVDQVLRRDYDVILMDCFMPIMDGYEATRRIRQAGGTAAATPIIALTAAAMADDRQKALDAGMDDYVAKPIAREDLLAAIRRCRGLVGDPRPMALD